MLSAKGRVCRNKVYILDKMQTLRNRLQGYIEQGVQKVQKREADESAAKSAWLDEEAQYLLQKKKAEDADATLAQDLKKVEALTSLLELNKARLAKVRASVTEQLSEIDEEEAIIRELLGYIGDLHSSTVDVVRLRFVIRAALLLVLACSLTAISYCVHGRMSHPCPRSSARESTSSCNAPPCAARPRHFRLSRSEPPPSPPPSAGYSKFSFFHAPCFTTLIQPHRSDFPPV